MKQIHYIFIIFLALTFSAIANTLANVSGTVFNRNTGEPISDAKVLVKELNKTYSTDNEGKFSIDIMNGKYTLIASVDDVAGYPTTISTDKTTKVNLTVDTLVTEFDDIIVEEDKSNRFGMSNLLPVDGAAIYSGRKSEALYMNSLTANLASNNSRQVFSKFTGMNIWENDNSGLQLNIGGRGLSPNRSSNFNTRQNGYDISADALGYPESYYTPPMEALEKIEVVRGASSLQYGTQFGGFLNFKLKDGAKDVPVDIVSRQTLSSYDNFNSFNSIGGTYGDMNYYGFIQYKQGNDFRPNSNYDALTFFIKNSYDISEDLSITAEFTHMNYLAKQSGGLTDAMFNSNPDQSVRDRNWFGVSWDILAGVIDYKLASNLKVNSRTFYLNASRNALGYLVRPDRTDPQQERDLIKGEFHNLGNETRLLYSYNLEENTPSTLLTGFRMYNGRTLQSQGFGNAGDGANFNYIGTQPMRNEYTNPSTNYAFFAENLFRIGRRFTITPGFRFERITTGSEGYYSNTVRDLAGNIILHEQMDENRENTRNFTLLGISAGYKINEDIESYVNISQNYRAVTFNDMRVVNPSMRIDTDLQDENGYSGDIGVRGNVDQLLYFDANVFYLYYNDKIGSVLREDEKTFTPYLLKTNISDSRSIGLELFTEINLNELLQLSDNYSLNYFVNGSYTNAVFLQSKETAYDGNLVEYTPPVIFRTGLSYKSEEFRASFSYSYVQEHFSDATNADNSASGITGLIPTYDVFDLSFSYSFGLVQLESGINNLLDNSYFTRRATGYPGPGIIPAARRSIYFTIGITP
ncbi:MAG: TonB-dependent receptor domain-containing protein [Chlorobiota bacterium]